MFAYLSIIRELILCSPTRVSEIYSGKLSKYEVLSCWDLTGERPSAGKNSTKPSLSAQ